MQKQKFSLLALSRFRQLIVIGLTSLLLLAPTSVAHAGPAPDPAGGGGTTTTTGGCDNNTSATCSACPSGSATAAGCPQSGSDPGATCATNGSGGSCDIVAKYVNPAINLLSVTFGLFAVISIILGGINYATSGGDPDKANKAKRRIANTVIGLVAYIFLYAFLQFVIPGGAFR